MSEGEQISLSESPKRHNWELLYHFFGALGLSAGLLVLAVSNSDIIERHTGVSLPSLLAGSQDSLADADAITVPEAKLSGGAADTDQPASFSDAELMLTKPADDIAIYSEPDNPVSRPAMAAALPPPITPSPFPSSSFADRGLSIIDPTLARLHHQRGSRLSGMQQDYEQTILAREELGAHPMINLDPAPNWNILNIDYEALSQLEFCILDCPPVPGSE